MQNHIRRLITNDPSVGGRFLQAEHFINTERNKDRTKTPRIGFVLCFSKCVTYLGHGTTNASRTEQIGRNLDNLLLGREIMLETYAKVPILEKKTPGLDLYIEGGLITPSNFNPEAPWLFRIFNGKEYIGKIGANYHLEGGKMVMSIVTIQGARESQALRRVSRLLRKEETIWPVEFVRAVLERIPSDITIRGIRGAKHPEVRNGRIEPGLAQVRYDQTFESLEMTRVHDRDGEGGYYQIRPAMRGVE